MLKSQPLLITTYIRLTPPFWILKKLIIVGAGGFGREVYQWAAKNPGNNTLFSMKGFLDDNPDALQNYRYPLGVLGNIADYEIKSDDVFLCAIGNPQAKEQCVKTLQARGAKFTNLIHPSAVLGSNITIGQGIIICPNVVVSADIKIGDFVSIDSQSVLGHDCELGHFSHVATFSAVTGGSKLGQRVFVGSHSTVLPTITVGDDAVIGAGSVVTKPVPAGITVVGVPARKLK